MFEHLDDEVVPSSDPDTVDAVVGRAAGLRRRRLLTVSAVATLGVVALVGVTAGAAAMTSDDGTRTAAASGEELEAPGEPEVGTPPPSTAPPTTAPKAPPTSARTEVAGKQVEAPAAPAVPAPAAPPPVAPAPAPTGSYEGTVVAASGWTVDVRISGPGSASFTGLTNGSPFSKAGVKTGTYTLEWTAESAPGDPDIGTAIRVGRQQFTVVAEQTASVTVVV